MKAHVFISGFVQGVGFRHFVLRQAQHLRLTGWIKNLPDGRVEALFVGDESALKSAISFCKKGPFLSEVENVEVAYEQTEEKFSDFKILR